MKTSPENTAHEERTALFTGSFNPFTVGHASIVERGLRIFDRIVIGIGVNADKQGSGAAPSRPAIEEFYVSDPRVSVITFTGLAVDAARQVGACALLRGVRNATDFQYERNMADINRRLTGIETVLLFSLPEHDAISSSLVRELASYGVDTSPFLPQTTQPKDH